MADLYAVSQPTRARLAELLEQGLTLAEAIRQAMPNDSNASRKVKKWKENNVYPFGKRSMPRPGPGQMELVQPTRTRTEVVLPASPTISTELSDTIRAIVRQELMDHKPVIEVKRPKLERNVKTSQMKSFRCPILLWNMATAKAETLNMSLNGIIESLLYQWLDRPKELLRKK